MMKRSCVAFCALVALGSGPVRAAPPTVVPSPGYDARLQEQRAARAAASGETAVNVRKRVAPRRHKHGRLH